MGLSSSQGRMLSLTARLSNLEYQAQSISNQKIRLADQSQAISKNYLDALDAKKLKAYNSQTNSYNDLTVNSLYALNANGGTQRVLVDATGKVVCPDSYKSQTIGAINANGEADNFSATVDAKGYAAANPNDAKNFNSTEWLYDQLSKGNLFLVEYNRDGGAEGTGAWEEISWSSGDSSLATVADESEVAKAEADYETAMAEIQSKDKRFDLQLETIDTEHNAVQQEMDSVNKVMDKNIERTFKIFS